MFQDSPETQASFVNQISQIQSQLSPSLIGQQTLDQMVDDLLIRQEAQRRNITVSDDEVDQAFQEALGYFPDGIPTSTPTLVSLPTSTLSALQKTLVPPTPTLTGFVSLEAFRGPMPCFFAARPTVATALAFRKSLRLKTMFSPPLDKFWSRG